MARKKEVRQCGVHWYTHTGEHWCRKDEGHGGTHVCTACAHIRPVTPSQSPLAIRRRSKKDER